MRMPKNTREMDENLIDNVSVPQLNDTLDYLELIRNKVDKAKHDYKVVLKNAAIDLQKIIDLNRLHNTEEGVRCREFIKNIEVS